MFSNDDKLFNAGQHYGSAGLSRTSSEPMTDEQLIKIGKAYFTFFPKFRELTLDTPALPDIDS